MSARVQITGLEDYLAPSAECVVPINVAPPRGTVQRTSAADRRRRAPAAAPAAAEETKSAITIELRDCLACSGCITSAESVLVEQQTGAVLKAALEAPGAVIVSLAPQSVAAVAAFANTSYVEALVGISAWLRHAGAAAVVTTDLGQLLATQATIEEFKQRSGDLYVSSCPGVVAYLEKTHPKLIPRVSTVGSPLVLTDRLISTYLAENSILERVNGLPADGQYSHVSIQPCFDRKLEVVRSETVAAASVVGTIELLALVGGGVEEAAKKIVETEKLDSNGVFQALECAFDVGVSEVPSGGYAKVLGEGVRPEQGANPDQIFYGDRSSAVSAAFYGFRNLQNLVRRAESSSHRLYELMACPHGCTHGGAQVPHGANPATCATAANLMAEAPAAAGIPAWAANVQPTIEIFKATEERQKARETAEKARGGFTTVELADW